jgi:leucyl-tRNA synthetase
MELVTEEQKEEVEKLLKKIKSTSEKDMEELEKEGASTGSYAINPLTNDKVPIYVGNFVIAEYGSGMVMGVPAHDQRDFEFAKKYNIPTKIVIQNKEKNLKVENMKRAYTDEGILVNSGKFNGLNSREAIEKISDYLEELKIGKRTVQYKLKDWLISRQRYWGTPIPIIYCDKCGVVPIPEKDLPVELPEKVKFGEGNPLTTNEEFVNTKCPKCGGPAKRETDTMDTFVNSSWYFLRYCDSKNDKEIFDEKKVEYWMPIDLYIGGKEHACMHLIYFRFYVKFLRDLGLLTFDEPVIKLFNQGMLHGPDGAVMSKSRGNVVLPETVSEVYGIDTARLFLVSLASPDKDVKWSDKGIKGTLKFINKIFKYFDKVKVGKSSRKVESKLNKIIKEVTEDIENLKYNLAVIKIRELFDSLEEEVSKDTLEKFLKLLSPFCPHITEELWEKLGNKEFISLAEWPKYDESKIDESIENIEKIISILLEDIETVIKLSKLEKPKKIKIIIPEKWKYDLFLEIKKVAEKTRNFGELMKVAMKFEEAKKMNKEIQKVIKRFLNGSLGLFDYEEINTIKESKKFLEKEFGCEIEILEIQEKESWPGKFGIIVE